MILMPQKHDEHGDMLETMRIDLNSKKHVLESKR